MKTEIPEKEWKEYEARMEAMTPEEREQEDLATEELMDWLDELSPSMAFSINAKKGASSTLQDSTLTCPRTDQGSAEETPCDESIAQPAPPGKGYD